MISSQPIISHRYFSLKKLQLHSQAHRYFYASWEDALWDILRVKKIKTSAKILVPEFFCPDVISNMISHRLEPVTYPCDRYFYTSTTTFRTHLKQHQPDLVIIFHPAGITNSLIEEYSQWKDYLPEKCLIIEDNVHKIINPKKITFLNQRHFQIDSLRKVVPLPGSNLYSPVKLERGSHHPYAPFSYHFGVLGWWLLFQIFLFSGSNSKNPTRQNSLYAHAERTMLKGYDLIGDSLIPSKGWPLFAWLASYLAIEKIEFHKTIQVKRYIANLKKISSSRIFFIPIKSNDYGKLRGYPLGLEINSSQKILDHIRNAGLLVRFELNESQWSQKHKVIYLPIGLHVSLDDIDQVCLLITKSLESNTSGNH